jgi:hypothetical protein
VTGDGVRRLTAAVGISAVVVTFVGWLLVPGDPPGVESPPEQIVRWTLDDRRSLLVGSVLIAAGLALAVAFFAGLRALCGRAEGAPGILATIGWGSMLVGLAVAIVGVALVQTQSFLVLNGDPATVEAFHEARLVLLNTSGLPIAFGFVAFGAAMVRTRYPSRWLGGAAGVAAVAQMLGVAALSRTGFFSPAGGAGTVSALTFGLWVAAASISLFVQKSAP